MSHKILPHNPGLSAWYDLSPQKPQAYECVVKDLHVDWLIIGGGFAGLAAAYRLAELNPTARIALAEGSRIAEGAAGRNSGFMIDLPHHLAGHKYDGDLQEDLRHTRLNRAGIAFARQVAKKHRFKAEAFAETGKINAAASKTEMRNNESYSHHLKRLNEPHKMLSQKEMQKICGTDYYQGGLFTSGTAMIQPALFITSLAKAVHDKGVMIYEKAPILSLLRQADKWQAETQTNKIYAAKVILAVNGLVQKFGLFERRLMHVFTYASMTRKLVQAEIKALGGHAHWGVTPAHPMGTTVRRICGSGGDRLLIRNRATYEPSMGVNEQRMQKITRSQDKAFARRFPMLKGVEMEYRWGGRLCLSRNNVSAFGEVDRNLYSACCQNGLGTAKGLVSGLLAAELSCDSEVPLLQDLLCEAAPTKLPPEPFAYLGINAAIRWGELFA